MLLLWIFFCLVRLEVCPVLTLLSIFLRQQSNTVTADVFNLGVLQSPLSASSDAACVCLCLHVSVCLPVCLPVQLSVRLSICVSVIGMAMSHSTCSGTTAMRTITVHLHVMSKNCQSFKMCMCITCISSVQTACMQDHADLLDLMDCRLLQLLWPTSLCCG